MMVSSVAPNNVGVVSLIDYLTRRFTYLSAHEWMKRIEEGRILHNGVIEDNAFVRLSKGDSIAYDCFDSVEPPADLKYRILYEDEWLLGVHKPGNLLVHKAGKSLQSNLVYQLRYCHLPFPYPAINAVNRLDRETSGIVLFAKDKMTLRLLHEALMKRLISKEYIAVVNGVPRDDAWTIRLPIGKDACSSIHYKYAVDAMTGKNAETQVETMRILKDATALLRIRPITGRTHQIRVHLAACGLPIIGDKLYGMSETDFLAWRSNPAHFEQNLQFPRQALHCASVSFFHPIIKKQISIEAPLPQDMANLLKTLAPTLI